jgi:5-methylcytosine-specific restriction endonuclease McrA
MTKLNPQAEPWRTWYRLNVWRKRSAFQLRQEPLCAHCLEQGRITPAKVADHIQPHRGNWNDFRLGKLQSLCLECHAHKRDSSEVRPYLPKAVAAIGDDGLPLSTDHPFNKRR